MGRVIHITTFQKSQRIDDPGIGDDDADGRAHSLNNDCSMRIVTQVQLFICCILCDVKEKRDLTNHIALIALAPNCTILFDAVHTANKENARDQGLHNNKKPASLGKCFCCCRLYHSFFYLTVLLQFSH